MIMRNCLLNTTDSTLQIWYLLQFLVIILLKIQELVSSEWINGSVFDHFN